VLWVDDIAIISKTREGVQAVKDLLSFRFEIRDLGELLEYLGLNITRDRANRKLWLTQHSYIEKILKCYHMADVASLSHPASTVKSIAFNSALASRNQAQLFPAMLGSAMYAAVWSRPDISKRCSKQGSAASNPSDAHDAEIRRLFKYLRVTKYLGIYYSAEEPILEVHSLRFVGYSDSSFADRNDSKSTSGYVFKLAAGPVSWKSRKQSVTATS
jgi:hypothetical protein